MTSAEWEAANEDDSDRWACYPAQTGLHAPNSHRVVWRDRGERIAALEAENARLAAAVSEAQSEREEDRAEIEQLTNGYNAQVQHGRKQWVRAESAEAEVERLRKVEEGIRALADECKRDAASAPEVDTFGEIGAAVDSATRHVLGLLAVRLRALLSPSPAATTGEATCLCGEALRPGFGSHSCNARPAPVSSGEAATGEAWDVPRANAWDEGWACCSDWWHANAAGESHTVDTSNPYRAAPVSSGEAATGEAGCICFPANDDEVGHDGDCPARPNADGSE